jgi:prepilin-type N-terminal cleavage/methylation domain-containing protein
MLGSPNGERHATTRSGGLAGVPVARQLQLAEMRLRLRSRGFTLIEVMTVVAIIGVLSLLAVVAYKRWVRTSYMAEAQDMLQNIRAAEEAFKAETGGYLNVSTGLDVPNTYPATHPGAFKSSWGGACGGCVSNTSWAMLAVEPKGPVAFGYAVVANNAGTAPSSLTSVTNALNSLLTPVSLSNLGLATGGTARAPWYVDEAVGDINGDGIYTRLLGNSDSNQVIIDREGE